MVRYQKREGIEREKEVKVAYDSVIPDSSFWQRGAPDVYFTVPEALHLPPADGRASAAMSAAMLWWRYCSVGLCYSTRGRRSQGKS